MCWYVILICVLGTYGAMKVVQKAQVLSSSDGTYYITNVEFL